MSIAEKLNAVAENEKKVYDAGKQAEYNDFWDVYQQNGKRTDYNQAFGNLGWTNETFNPKYDLICSASSGMFAYAGITNNLKQLLIDKGIILDTSKSSNASYMFRNSKLTHLPFLDLSNAGYLGATFAYSPDLTELSIKVNENATFPNCFDYDTSLTDVTVSGTIGNEIRFTQSPLLSSESVQSIIDALKDLTGKTSKKVYFHSSVLERITDEQFATITAKNWTI